MLATPTRFPSTKKCLPILALRKPARTQWQECPRMCSYPRNQHEKEKNNQKTSAQVETLEQHRSRTARTTRLLAERRRSARSFHGRARRFSRRQIRDVRERPPAHWLAVARTLAHRPARHPRIQQESQARPGGYWPKTPMPPDDKAWHNSVAAFQKDLTDMVRLVQNPRTDLFAKIPHGQGQTILREALVLADHNAYHLGQLVDLRRALGAWPEV